MPLSEKNNGSNSTELNLALGPTSDLWDQLVISLTVDRGISDTEWHSLKPQYGWGLIFKIKKRRTLYLIPRSDCLRVSFTLRDKVLAAARASALPRSVAKILEEAPHYPEGGGVHLLIKTARDPSAVRMLAQLKIAKGRPVDRSQQSALLCPET